MDGKVTAQAIGKYERGERAPSSGVLSALSKALGVPQRLVIGDSSCLIDLRKASLLEAFLRLPQHEMAEYLKRYAGS